MTFRNIIKDIIESKVINEEEFDSKDSKLFSDFLSNKKAIDIIDGLLKKSKNNPKRALDALETMSRHVGDGFQNKQEVDKAKVALQALNKKEKLSKQDINKLKAKFGKDWDLIWKWGDNTQKSLGLAVGGVAGAAIAAASGGLVNAGLNSVKNWARDKYINRGFHKESIDEYQQLQQKIVEAISTHKEQAYKVDDAIKTLIKNDINPGFYRTMGVKPIGLFLDNSGDPYELTAIVDRYVINDSKMVSLRKAQLKFTKMFHNAEEQPTAKYFSINEFKNFIENVRNTESNFRTKKSLEFLDRYYSNNMIAQKKLNDIEVLRERLFNYCTQLIKNDIIKTHGNQVALSNEDKEKILDASLLLNKKIGDYVDKQTGIDFIFVNTNIDKNLIEQFVQPFVNNKGLLVFDWFTKIREKSALEYNLYKKANSLNDLLENLDINVKEAPKDEAYYWQQLIRTTYDNPTPFYAKRFMPYDKVARDPIEVTFDDEKKTNQWNNSVKTVENPLLPYLSFYYLYQSDLIELKAIKKQNSKFFTSFLEDLGVDANSPKAAEIMQNINISDNYFIQYKILYGDKYKNNINSMELDVTDSIVGTNFIYFKNNAAYDIEYKQVKSESDKIKNNMTYNKQNKTFLIDMSDTIFNPNEELLENSKIKVNADDIANIKHNIKSALDNYQEVNVEKTIDNVTVPSIIIKMFDALMYAQDHDENEQNKFMYSHLFLTFLYAYSQNKANKDFISSYNELSQKMASKGKQDKIFDGIMALLQQSGVINQQKTFKENIEAYWDKIGNTIDYQDGEYRLINISSIGYLHPGEVNTNPVFIFECVSNKKDYDQALSVSLEGLHDFIENKTLKRNTFRVYENPLPSIMNKKLNSEKYHKSNQPEEITKARILYLILDKLNQVFDPQRAGLWTGFLGAFGAQVGETIEDVFRIKSIFVAPAKIRLKYDNITDRISFLSPAKEGESDRQLSDQEIKEIAPQAFVLKMTPYSDLIGVQTDKTNRKNIKTPTTKILLEDFIHVLTIEDPKEQIEEYNKRSDQFSVLTSIGNKKANSLQRKLKWLQSQRFFGDPKSIENKELQKLRTVLTPDVVKELQNMLIAIEETNKTLGANDFSKKEYMSWFPDTQEMSNVRGVFKGSRIHHHNSEVNNKLGIMRK